MIASGAMFNWPAKLPQYDDEIMTATLAVSMLHSEPETLA
jgi:hypothetical protein